VIVDLTITNYCNQLYEMREALEEYPPPPFPDDTRGDWVALRFAAADVADLIRAQLHAGLDAGDAA
jgi:hypothetical protein